MTATVTEPTKTQTAAYDNQYTATQTTVAPTTSTTYIYDNVTALRTLCLMQNVAVSQ